MNTTPRQDTNTRALAYDLDAERIVLGALMTSHTLIDETAATLSADDFYSPKHATIYTTILNARDTGHPTDTAAINGLLSDSGDLTRIGNTYLADCYAAVPIAAQISHYAGRIIELAHRRRLEATGIRITQAATTPGYTADDVATLAEDLIQQAQPRREDQTMVQLGALLNPGLEAIEHRKTDPGGLPTGFTDLDRMLGGLRPKQLVTVAAPTGCGKSVFLTDVARHLAIKKRHTVAMFSLEMSREELFERILSAESAVPHHVIRSGNLDDGDWHRIGHVLSRLSDAPMFICDQSEITVTQIKNKCRILQHRHGLDAVIVDYVQLISPSRRHNNEQERIADASRALKLLAGDLEVPVIAAAQMNRGPDGRIDKTPQLSDIRASGAIANDSSAVILIHRPDYYDSESTRAGEADFVVAKNRHGARDTVTVAAQLHLSRFADMAIA